ncbi:helix-turn-helix domain-containing protein [Chryseobacterium sp. SSA4.19]|uniref:helix-turn-helix domain-containing protein n=1 Tax=Chryseobacterium sp. SSA4.19 TaxID=2919915 RepID=UPI001F4E367B|nr:helix-turn-helix domain-containing protein [Chryseobacterium sp. SSA4.19]MCJ8154830.1 helix-turn-helix domain-containing protein [Chryseobacterium sp. SSA4.19]
MKTKFNGPFSDEEQFKGTLLAFLSEILKSLDRKETCSSGYYDSADVKQMLNISDRTLHRLRKSKAVPYMRIGRKIFYPKSFFSGEPYGGPEKREG